jgi:hypothetical protein
MLTPSGSLFQYRRNMKSEHIAVEIQTCSLCSIDDVSSMIVYPICFHPMHFGCFMDTQASDCPVCHSPPPTLLKLLLDRLAAEQVHSQELKVIIEDGRQTQVYLEEKENDLDLREMVLKVNERSFAEEARKLKRKKIEMIEEEVRKRKTIFK